MWKINFCVFVIIGTLSILFEHIYAAKDGWRRVYSDRGHPYIASIQYTTDDPKDPNATYVHKCTGSIIYNKHILTAANCFDDLDEDVQLAVNVGVNDKTDRTEKSQFILVDEKIIHPDYDREDQHANLAILKLKDSIRFRREIQPIRPSTPEFTPNGQGILYGWNGRLRKSQRKVPKKLLIARVSVLPTDECQTYYPDLLGDQFCVVGLKTMNAPCRGTPGIPFQHISKDMYFPIVTGVATYWPEDCEGPALFTSINNYSDFTAKIFEP